jgi:nucleoside-diphosphate-sugar epimerase
MIYQLYTQMKAGKRPRVFRAGEQERDFVYVKDAVAMTILALVVAAVWAVAAAHKPSPVPAVH